jgi:hypothetical protein
MHMNKFELRKNIEQARPVSGLIDETSAHELQVYIKDAEEASLIAHKALYDGFHNNDPRVVTFTDDHNQPGKYISFADTEGSPTYGPWNKENPASDIGIRGANPEFPGVINPSTVIHADFPAINDFLQKGAPGEVIDAIAATAKLNEHVKETVAKPYLADVARAFDVEPEAYLDNFFARERDRREQILTRVIMYHLVAAPGQRPIGSDGTPLLIKEHVDKSSWTIDIAQTAPGLQYRVNKQWHDAHTDIATFRGTADSYLPLSTLPATLHRAVTREYTPNSRLSQVGIGRIAVPMFISPIHEDARVVQSDSAETHPTEYKGE